MCAALWRLSTWVDGGQENGFTHMWTCGARTPSVRVDIFVKISKISCNLFWKCCLKTNKTFLSGIKLSEY